MYALTSRVYSLYTLFPHKFFKKTSIKLQRLQFNKHTHSHQILASEHMQEGASNNMTSETCSILSWGLYIATTLVSHCTKTFDQSDTLSLWRINSKHEPQLQFSTKVVPICTLSEGLSSSKWHPPLYSGRTNSQHGVLTKYIAPSDCRYLSNAGICPPRPTATPHTKLPRTCMHIISNTCQYGRL